MALLSFELIVYLKNEYYFCVIFRECFIDFLQTDLDRYIANLIRMRRIQSPQITPCATANWWHSFQSSSVAS